MLLIRKEQLAVLTPLHVDHFNQRLREHIQQQFPEFCAAHSDDQLEDEIRHASLCAVKFGFTTAFALCRFMNLQIVLGRDFDAYPENAWMREWLDPADELNPHARILSLYDEATVRLRYAELHGRGRAGTANE